MLLLKIITITQERIINTIIYFALQANDELET